MIGKFRDFISREPIMLGSWNLVCVGLSAFLISRNFCDPKFGPERRHLVTPLFKPLSIPMGTAIRDLPGLVTFERSNKKFCRSGFGAYSTRRIEWDHFRRVWWPWSRPHCSKRRIRTKEENIISPRSHEMVRKIWFVLKFQKSARVWVQIKFPFHMKYF